MLTITIECQSLYYNTLRFLQYGQLILTTIMDKSVRKTSVILYLYQLIIQLYNINNII
jgi:hypothetical protein